MSLLERILAAKRQEIETLRQKRLPPPRALRPLRLTGGGQAFQLICEFKRRSPSAGELSTALSAGERAALYEANGATMMSVLCDTPFFGGSYSDLEQAYESSSLPLLAKEFILDEVQLDAARSFGASAALLIVRCLEVDQLARLHRAAIERELVPIVEVVSPEEAELALDIGAETLGVNARDLNSLAMDGERAAEVLAHIPREKVRLHFSGVKSPEQVLALRERGLDGALIGESLMREADPTLLLQAFVRAATKQVA